MHGVKIFISVHHRGQKRCGVYKPLKKKKTGETSKEELTAGNNLSVLSQGSGFKISK